METIENLLGFVHQSVFKEESHQGEWSLESCSHQRDTGQKSSFSFNKEVVIITTKAILSLLIDSRITTPVITVIPSLLAACIYKHDLPALG